MIKPLRGRWSSRTDGNRWSLAVKVGLLNIGLCAALAFVLTGLATYRGFTGLERQAEVALAADAGIVADGVDNWHAQRVAQLKALANMHLLQDYATADDDTRALTRATVRDVLIGHNSVADDVDSIALTDATGTFVASS